MSNIRELLTHLIERNGMPDRNRQVSLPTLDEVADFQNHVPFVVPDWFKYYLLHNAFADCTFVYMVDGHEMGEGLLNFQNILLELEFHQRAHPHFPFPVLPFTDGNGAGDYHYVTIHDDLSKVQLIEIFHDEENEWRLISENLFEFLYDKAIS